MKLINVPKEIHDAQILFVSHSGGKDSQATLAALARLNLLHKVVLIHSDLGEMEWQEMKPWIEANSFDLPCNVVKANETFFDMCRKEGRLPAGNMQFCTDRLKTTPITKFIHDYMYQNNVTVAVNVTGMRAEESERRANKKPFTLSRGKHTSGMDQPINHPTHKVYDWLPVFDFNTLEVFAEIAAAGQQPHELYSMGFSRLSCVFCINGRIDEHQKAAVMRPELALKIANLERELGKTYRMKQRNKIKLPRFFDEYLTGLPPMAPTMCGGN
jgi:3'-phosphoadenosine 5'-phosphosulfate sulfotransferase (PAPS reductase)/FAD synthetase